MHRWTSLVIVLIVAGPVIAQDMPLSQILIDGEGWRLVEPGAAPKFPEPKEITTANGWRYSVEPDKGEVRQERIGGIVTATQHLGLARPSCVALWPDQGFLVVGDAEGKYLWAFRIEQNGRIGPGDRYYSLRVPAGKSSSGVAALTVDTAGRVYACTPLGVQIFDPTGRLSGVLLKPGDGSLTGITFGGPERDTLIVRSGDKVFARKTQAKGLPLAPEK